MLRMARIWLLVVGFVALIVSVLGISVALNPSNDRINPAVPASACTVGSASPSLLRGWPKPTPVRCDEAPDSIHTMPVPSRTGTFDEPDWSRPTFTHTLRAPTGMKSAGSSEWNRPTTTQSPPAH